MIRCLLLDIEGTTTSVSFVFDVLFPYFRDHIPQLRDRLDDPQIKEILTQVQAIVEEEEGLRIDLVTAIDRLHQWSVEDRKIAPLKTLQGILWEEGYRQGDFRGHVYTDVPPCLAQWQRSGLELAIYSSGSVQAQKLLFGYSDFGDLTDYFKWYFDLKVGHKRESSSYQKIAQTTGFHPSEILFLSDVPEELDAAATAGLRTLQLLRSGTQPSDRHGGVASFEEIDPMALP